MTGGGILGNLARVFRTGSARIDWDAWQRPPVFDWLARHVEEEELRRVFNIGIGFCAVVPTAPGEPRDRARRRDRRPRHRRGDEPAGADRRAAADRGRRVEPGGRARARPGRRRRHRHGRLRARRLPDRDARDGAMAAWLGRGVDLVVCAGYMHLLRASFLDRFPGRIVNTHSAPLPAFPGAHPSRTCSPPACRRPAPPSTTSTRAWTRARSSARSRSPCCPATRPTRFAQRVQETRAPPAARGRREADRLMRACSPSTARTGLEEFAPRPGGARRRARRERRHGDGARGRRARGDARRGLDRGAGDAGRPRQDAAPARSTRRSWRARDSEDDVTALEEHDIRRSTSSA